MVHNLGQWRVGAGTMSKQGDLFNNTGSSSGCVVWSDQMIRECWIVKDVEADMANFEDVSQHLLGTKEENHESPKSE